MIIIVIIVIVQSCAYLSIAGQNEKMITACNVHDTFLAKTGESNSCGLDRPFLNKSVFTAEVNLLKVV